MTGIFYFSSTGNSLFIAEEIQKSLGGELFYIPKFDGDLGAYDKVIIVSPIYSFGLPVHVYDFICNAETAAPIYIVLNYGGMQKGAKAFAYNLCKERNLDIKAVFAMKMPENFTLTFQVPGFYLKSTLKKSGGNIEKIIKNIKNGVSESGYKVNKKYTDIHYKNKANWHKIGEDFVADDSCILCGKCVEICPANNISVSDGKIKFSNKCVACLGCYHRCPQRAINYKGKTKKRKRYFNPYVNEEDLGK